MSFSSPAGGPIATAFVEIEADLSSTEKDVDSFLKRLRKKVDTAGELTGEDLQDAFEEAARQIDNILKDIGGPGIFAPLEGEAEAAGEGIEDTFRETQRQADEALQGIGGAGTFTEVENHAETAGEAIERVFEEASRSIAASIRDTSTDAKATGEVIENAFKEAALQAERALESIGGPEAFADIPGGAERAGEAIENAFIEARRAAKEALKDIGTAEDFGLLGLRANAIGETIEQAFREAAAGAAEDLRDIGTFDFTPVVVSAEIAAETVERSFRDASRDSSRALAHINSSGTGFGLLASGALGAGAALGIASAAMVGFGVKSAATLEQTQIGFESLLGSAQAAGDFIKELQQFAATTPFEFQGLADNARRLLAVGEAAGIARDEILPTLTVIGDLTAVLGAPAEAIDRVNTALAQMASKGKVSTEELLQLGEALPGFPVFQALAEGLGISGAALQDKLQAGAIGAQEGIAALLKGMKEFPGAAGAMAKQAETLNGLFSTFKDTVSLALTDAFQPLIPTIKTTLAEATPIIGQALQGIAPGLSKIAGSLLTTLLDVFAGLAPGLSAIFGGLGEAFEILGPTIGFVAKEMSTAFAPLAQLLPVIAKALEPILFAFGQLAASVLPPLINIITTVIRAFTPFLNIISKIVQRLALVFQPVLEQIAEIFVELGGVVAEFFDELFDSGVIDTFASAFEKLAPVLGQVAKIIGGALIQVFQKLAPSLTEIIELMADQFVTVVEALIPVLPELAEAAAQIAVALADLLVALLPLILPLVKFQTLLIKEIGAPVLVLIAKAVALLATALATLVTVLISSVGPALDAVVAAFGFLWNDILVPLHDFLKAVFIPLIKVFVAVIIGPMVASIATSIAIFKVFWQNVLVPLGQFLSSIFGPIVKTIISAFSLLANAVKSNATPVINAFKTALSIAGDVINKVKGFIGTLVTAVRNNLKPVIDGVKGAFDAMGRAISTVSGFVSSLLGLVKKAIDLIAKLIKKIKDIPGAGVVEDITSGVGSVLSHLQHGGIITQDTLASLHSPEVVIPLNEPKRALALAKASGLLDILSQQSRPTTDSIGSGTLDRGLTSAAGGGLNIGTLNVTLERGTEAEVNAAANAFVDTVRTTLQRRQIALTVRTT